MSTYRPTYCKQCGGDDTRANRNRFESPSSIEVRQIAAPPSGNPEHAETWVDAGSFCSWQCLVNYAADRHHVTPKYRELL